MRERDFGGGSGRIRTPIAEEFDRIRDIEVGKSGMSIQTMASAGKAVLTDVPRSVQRMAASGGDWAGGSRSRPRRKERRRRRRGARETNGELQSETSPAHEKIAGGGDAQREGAGVELGPVGFPDSCREVPGSSAG